jgi:4'-phosphopantetheinyl transferase
VNDWYLVSEVPTLAEGEVHVWRAALDRPDAELQRFRELLAPDERARAERFYFETHRRHFTAGRGILRALLGEYLGLRPAQVAFRYGPQGKPALADGLDDLRFNLAHAHGLALVAVSRGHEVGVDLERIREDYACDEVAGRFFSPNEVAVLRGLPPELRREAFFTCWSRKEAYIKATGRGLSQALDQFDVSLAPGAPAALLATRHDPPDAGRWSLYALHPGPGYAGAVAVEGQGHQLWCGQWPEAGTSRAVGRVLVAVAPGELLDKLTILQIKSERVHDPAKLQNIRRELAEVEAARDQAQPRSEELTRLTAELKAVNEQLWEIEDALRICERDGDFGPRFVELARAVYRTNDRRGALKRRINDLLGSELIEEKQYADYGQERRKEEG